MFGVAALGSRAGDGARRVPRARAGDGVAPSPATDVFGLAATTVFALTGAPPAPGEPIAWEGVAPELAKRLDRVVRRALDPDPARRPPTATDFVERLVGGARAACSRPAS